MTARELGPDIIEGAWNRALAGKIRAQHARIAELEAELDNLRLVLGLRATDAMRAAATGETE